jgi:hypothetical protein
MASEVVEGEHSFEETLTEEQKYADGEYRRFLKEKDKYVDFDDFCRQEGI